MNEKSIKLLIIDDEKSQLESLAGYFKKRMKVLTSENVEDAKKIIDKTPIDIIITDYRMPDGNGIDILKYAKSLDNSIIVIIMTAFGTVETAVEAMQLGAFNYIQKPIDLDELEIVIQKAIENYNLIKENIILKEQLKETMSYGHIITESPKMKEILSMVSRIAPSEASVLIQGESGTGKELVAKAIHAASPRNEKPFIAFNVAALSETLVESELFGHEKGSFTGADKRKIGRFEQAHGGTLFIDEIGDISPKIQVKLLRVLQEKRFERVGGTMTIDIDVRIITATNKDITKHIREGFFREDLYYRINVVTIDIPPLRERKEDISLLVDYFLKKYSQKNRKEINGISKDALSSLMRYEFPGNIRELENLIERAVILCRTKIISSEDIGLPVHGEKTINTITIDGMVDLPCEIDKIEKQAIVNMLHETKGNQSEAARRLNINERTLRYKLNKYNLKR